MTEFGIFNISKTCLMIILRRVVWFIQLFCFMLDTCVIVIFNEAMIFESYFAYPELIIFEFSNGQLNEEIGIEILFS